MTSNVEHDKLHERATRMLASPYGQERTNPYIDLIGHLDASRERLKVALADQAASQAIADSLVSTAIDDLRSQLTLAAKIVELAVCPECHSHDPLPYWNIAGCDHHHLCNMSADYARSCKGKRGPCDNQWHSLIQEWRKGQ